MAWNPLKILGFGKKAEKVAAEATTKATEQTIAGGFKAGVGKTLAQGAAIGTVGVGAYAANQASGGALGNTVEDILKKFQTVTGGAGAQAGPNIAVTGFFSLIKEIGRALMVFTNGAFGQSWIDFGKKGVDYDPDNPATLKVTPPADASSSAKGTNGPDAGTPAPSTTPAATQQSVSYDAGAAAGPAGDAHIVQASYEVEVPESNTPTNDMTTGGAHVIQASYEMPESGTMDMAGTPTTDVNASSNPFSGMIDGLGSMANGLGSFATEAYSETTAMVDSNGQVRWDAVGAGTASNLTAAFSGFVTGVTGLGGIAIDTANWADDKAGLNAIPDLDRSYTDLAVNGVQDGITGFAQKMGVHVGYDDSALNVLFNMLGSVAAPTPAKGLASGLTNTFLRTAVHTGAETGEQVIFAMNTPSAPDNDDPAYPKPSPFGLTA